MNVATLSIFEVSVVMFEAPPSKKAARRSIYGAVPAECGEGRSTRRSTRTIYESWRCIFGERLLIFGEPRSVFVAYRFERDATLTIYEADRYVDVASRSNCVGDVLESDAVRSF